MYVSVCMREKERECVHVSVRPQNDVLQQFARSVVKTMTAWSKGRSTLQMSTMSVEKKRLKNATQYSI